MVYGDGIEGRSNGRFVIFTDLGSVCNFLWLAFEELLCGSDFAMAVSDSLEPLVFTTYLEFGSHFARTCPLVTLLNSSQI